MKFNLVMMVVAACWVGGILVTLAKGYDVNPYVAYAALVINIVAVIVMFISCVSIHNALKHTLDPDNVTHAASRD